MILFTVLTIALGLFFLYCFITDDYNYPLNLVVALGFFATAIITRMV